MKVLKENLEEEYLSSGNNENNKLGNKSVRFFYGDHYSKRVATRISSWQSIMGIVGLSKNKIEKEVKVTVDNNFLNRYKSLLQRKITSIKKENIALKVYFIVVFTLKSREEKFNNKLLFFKVPARVSRLYVSPEFEKEFESLIDSRNSEDADTTEIDSKLDSLLKKYSAPSVDYDNYQKYQGVYYPTLAVVFSTFISGFADNLDSVKEKDGDNYIIQEKVIEVNNDRNAKKLLKFKNVMAKEKVKGQKGRKQHVAEKV